MTTNDVMQETQYEDVRKYKMVQDKDSVSLSVAIESFFPAGQSSCPICLDKLSFQDAKNVVYTCERHAVHSNCLDDYLLQLIPITIDAKNLIHANAKNLETTPCACLFCNDKTTSVRDLRNMRLNQARDFVIQGGKIFKDLDLCGCNNPNEVAHWVSCPHHHHSMKCPNCGTGTYPDMLEHHLQHDCLRLKCPQCHDNPKFYSAKELQEHLNCHDNARNIAQRLLYFSHEVLHYVTNYEANIGHIPHWRLMERLENASNMMNVNQGILFNETPPPQEALPHIVDLTRSPPRFPPNRSENATPAPGTPAPGTPAPRTPAPGTPAEVAQSSNITRAPRQLRRRTTSNHEMERDPVRRRLI